MQRHVLLKAVLHLAITAFLLGCGAGGDGSLDPGDAADTSAGDTVLGDAMPDVTRAPGFELGSNPQGRNDPTSFVPLPDDDGELDIVLGPQGLWMVVLAFRTRGMLDGRLLLEATVDVGETQQGRLVLQDQPTFAGPEGWFYYYNFFLVVDDPTVTGQPATIAFKATDASGRVVERTLNANLVGGL